MAGLEHNPISGNRLSDKLCDKTKGESKYPIQRNWILLYIFSDAYMRQKKQVALGCLFHFRKGMFVDHYAIPESELLTVSRAFHAKYAKRH